MIEKQQRFRMTPWPSRLPSISEVTGFSPYRLDGDLLKLDLDAQMVVHEVPDETYLRGLYELDLEDADQILNFTNTYGRLGHPAQLVRRNEKGKPVLSSKRQLIRMLGVDIPNLRHLPWEEWWAEVEEWWADVGERSADVEVYPAPLTLGPVEKRLFYSDGLQHIDAFRGWARGFRRLTRLYHRYQMGETTEAEMEALGIIIGDLLGSFTPLLAVVAEAEVEGWSPTWDELPRLENILALQMFNHIADGEVFLVCGNETHGGLFVHQRGRAEKGQHRKKGVKFCSASCASAQTARNYRRRRASGEEGT